MSSLLASMACTPTFGPADSCQQDSCGQRQERTEEPGKLVLVDAAAMSRQADEGRISDAGAEHGLVSADRVFSVCRTIFSRCPTARILVFLEGIGYKRLCDALNEQQDQALWRQAVSLQCVPFGLKLCVVLLEFAELKASEGAFVAIVSNDVDIVVKGQASEKTKACTTWKRGWHHQGYMFIDGEVVLPGFSSFSMDQAALASVPTVCRVGGSARQERPMAGALEQGKQGALRRSSSELFRSCSGNARSSASTSVKASSRYVCQPKLKRSCETTFHRLPVLAKKAHSVEPPSIAELVDDVAETQRDSQQDPLQADGADVFAGFSEAIFFADTQVDASAADDTMESQPEEDREEAEALGAPALQADTLLLLSDDAVPPKADVEAPMAVDAAALQEEEEAKEPAQANAEVATSVEAAATPEAEAKDASQAASAVPAPADSNLSDAPPVAADKPVLPSEASLREHIVTLLRTKDLDSLPLGVLRSELEAHFLLPAGALESKSHDIVMWVMSEAPSQPTCDAAAAAERLTAASATEIAEEATGAFASPAPQAMEVEPAAEASTEATLGTPPSTSQVDGTMPTAGVAADDPIENGPEVTPPVEGHGEDSRHDETFWAWLARPNLYTMEADWNESLASVALEAADLLDGVPASQPVEDIIGDLVGSQARREDDDQPSASQLIAPATQPVMGAESQGVAGSQQLLIATQDLHFDSQMSQAAGADANGYCGRFALKALLAQRATSMKPGSWHKRQRVDDH
eukprot:TRINITY_DN9594_c0_g1_i1.p1 TRINITY_DN9594_c0_g1~~TRINITY_DN9594_c0_g1_i1.p1  ORF type:complete len:779 (+),score=191.51 TRINITY_DN9594_c0_g1_i1:84-2339(+)